MLTVKLASTRINGAEQAKLSKPFPGPRVLIADHDADRVVLDFVSLGDSYPCSLPDPQPPMETA